MKRKIFISYSWDSDSHCLWVYDLAIRLRELGLTVLIDQDLKPGYHILRFVERAITESDFVLIICTPRYKSKADSGHGGVGYEGGIISNEIYFNHNESKFIPILRKGSFSNALPNFCAGKKGVDLSSDPLPSNAFHILVKTITDNNTENDLLESIDVHNQSNGQNSMSALALDKYRRKIDDAKTKVLSCESLTVREQKTIESYLEEIIEETYQQSTSSEALKKSVERMIQGINDKPVPNNYSCAHELMHFLFTEANNINSEK